MAAIPRELVDGVFELILALTGEVPIALSCFVIPCLAYRAAVLERTPASTPLLGGGAVSEKPVSAAATTATLVFAVGGPRRLPRVHYLSVRRRLRRRVMSDGCASMSGGADEDRTLGSSMTSRSHGRAT